MHVTSLGYRTDLLFPAFDGEVLDRGSYRVIRTPSNPTYHWGNFLLFDHPPGEGDLDRWSGLFAREIGTPPAMNHMTFGWDVTTDTPGAIKPFLGAGFKPVHSTVLSADRLRAPSTGPAVEEIEIRPLATPREWGAVVENQVLCREPEYSEQDYREFSRRAMERYRRMTAAGLGAWYAAFLGETVVADLGVFGSGELGRFQSVQTHPAYRRRGIATALVFEASHHALRTFELETLVIVSEADSAAQRLYESLGFARTEHQWGLSRAPLD